MWLWEKNNKVFKKLNILQPSKGMKTERRRVLRDRKAESLEMTAVPFVPLGNNISGKSLRFVIRDNETLHVFYIYKKLQSFPS